MRLSSITEVLIALLACLWTLSAQTAFPKMTTINPNTAKAGDVITAAGENVYRNNVAELLLTNSSKDVKVQITEQSATEIKFTTPESLVCALVLKPVQHVRTDAGCQVQVAILANVGQGRSTVTPAAATGQIRSDEVALKRFTRDFRMAQEGGIVGGSQGIAPQPASRRRFTAASGASVSLNAPSPFHSDFHTRLCREHTIGVESPSAFPTLCMPVSMSSMRTYEGQGRSQIPTVRRS